MDLEIFRDRRVLFAAGGGVIALLAGLGIGVGLLARGHDVDRTPASSSASSAPGSLQVEMGHEDPGLDPQKPLRCFAGGKFVGMVTLVECAQKNGVATGSLDVGLDPSGAIAATTGDSSVLQPLPGAPVPPPMVASAGPGPDATTPETAAVSAPAASSGLSASCWRFTGEWRRLPEDMNLDGCVQALFSGRCERPGAADYGRWGGDTLRLVTGRVERSGDNRSFRTLVKQPTGDCSIPHLSE